MLIKRDDSQEYYVNEVLVEVEGGEGVVDDDYQETDDDNDCSNNGKNFKPWVSLSTWAHLHYEL